MYKKYYQLIYCIFGGIFGVLLFVLPSIFISETDGHLKRFFISIIPLVLLLCLMHISEHLAKKDTAFEPLHHRRMTALSLGTGFLLVHMSHIILEYAT